MPLLSIVSNKRLEKRRKREQGRKKKKLKVKRKGKKDLQQLKN